MLNVLTRMCCKLHCCKHAVVRLQQKGLQFVHLQHAHTWHKPSWPRTLSWVYAAAAAACVVCRHAHKCECRNMFILLGLQVAEWKLKCEAIEKREAERREAEAKKHKEEVAFLENHGELNHNASVKGTRSAAYVLQLQMHYNLTKFMQLQAQTFFELCRANVECTCLPYCRYCCRIMSCCYLGQLFKMQSTPTDLPGVDYCSKATKAAAGNILCTKEVVQDERQALCDHTQSAFVYTRSASCHQQQSSRPS